MSTKTTLLSKVGDPTADSGNKITVIGCGAVGMAVAVACLAQDITTEVALIDPSEDKVVGEKMDLQHGSLYLNNARIEAGSGYEISAGSKVCIITAGERQIEGESRLSLISRNFEIFKDIIPNLTKNSPDSVILVITNPVDILTYVAWKLSNFPKNRVIGSGTSLDSARFRYFIGQRLEFPPSAIEGWIIGEHGDSSVPVWSGVNVAGTRLCDLNDKIGTPEDEEKWGEVHTDVVKSAGEIIQRKGYTNWGIAFCVVPICKAIIQNTGQLFPLTTCVNGEHGVDRDIFLSLPCLIGAQGVTHIVKQTLTKEEQSKFLKSARTMAKVIDTLVFE